MMRESGESGWEFVQFTRYCPREHTGWHVALFKREVVDE